MERPNVASVGDEPSRYSGPLATIDAVLMAGVRVRRLRRTQTLFDWLDTMAWDGDSVPPSFEAVSYGLQRLLHAGLIGVGRSGSHPAQLRIWPTEAGQSLLRRARHGGYARGEVAERIAAVFAASVSLTDDRSLGPLKDLSADEWIHEYRPLEWSFLAAGETLARAVKTHAPLHALASSGRVSPLGGNRSSHGRPSAPKGLRGPESRTLIRLLGTRWHDQFHGTDGGGAPCEGPYRRRDV